MLVMHFPVVLLYSRTEKNFRMRVNSALGQVGLSQVGPGQLGPIIYNGLVIFCLLFHKGCQYELCFIYIMFSKSLREKSLVLSILLVCQTCFNQRVRLHYGKRDGQEIYF